MVESNFEYTEVLIKKINTNAIKKCGLITEIAMFFILLGAVVLFVTGNTIMGVISSIIFAVLLASLVFTNLSINKSNCVLVGQRVNVVFNDTKISMTTKLGNRVLYRANFDYNAVKSVKVTGDLIYIYFNKSSVVIVPKTSFKTSQDCKTALELVGNNYVI